MPPAASRARMVMALVLASAVGLSAITQPSLLNGASAGARFIADRARSATDADSMDKPLHVTEIDGAV